MCLLGNLVGVPITNFSTNTGVNVLQNDFVTGAWSQVVGPFLLHCFSRTLR